MCVLPGSQLVPRVLGATLLIVLLLSVMARAPACKNLGVKWEKEQKYVVMVSVVMHICNLSSQETEPGGLP